MWSCSAASVAWRRALALLLALSLSACGFQLRGSATAALPASLSAVRLTTAGVDEHHPLAEAVRQALARAGATITEASEAPALVLLGERAATRVAAVSGTTAKATEYLLQYQVSFRLDGNPSLPEQTIRLQRDLSFDPAQVLAREQQERELIANMRHEAAQQIVRRLSVAR